MLRLRPAIVNSGIGNFGGAPFRELLCSHGEHLTYTKRATIPVIVHRHLHVHIPSGNIRPDILRLSSAKSRGSMNTQLSGRSVAAALPMLGGNS